MSRKTIAIIATGGTIACSDSEKGLKPSYMLNEMLNELEELQEIAVIRPVQLMNKDSSDMTPEDWTRIAVAVYKELQYVDGIVVTHGTDTMAYTSSMLSFMIQRASKPIIVTGSQRPWNEAQTDAKRNLLDAVRVAAFGVENDIRGVHIVFHGKIIRGCRAKKSKFLERSELDAFDTINYPLVGLVKDKHILMNPILQISYKNGYKDQEPILDTQLDTRVFMLMLAPGFNTDLMDSIKEKTRAVIIQAYGLGDMPINGRDTLVPKVKEWLAEGKIVAVTSQACYETDLSRYETGKRFMDMGVIPTLDMTQESAYTKMMWALGHKGDIESVRKLMWTNVAGEIWQLGPNGHANGGPKTLDVMGEMARYHELTRRLYESNTQLMEVMGNIFSKIKNSQPS
ncbi:MAG: asparaginase [Candidatus Aenigmarchaeota archaeon]|nr:asparaginase [Candidatus Aenigmarchaeota archaeon]